MHSRPQGWSQQPQEELDGFSSPKGWPQSSCLRSVSLTDANTFGHVSVKETRLHGLSLQTSQFGRRTFVWASDVCPGRLPWQAALPSVCSATANSCRPPGAVGCSFVAHGVSCRLSEVKSWVLATFGRQRFKNGEPGHNAPGAVLLSWEGAINCLTVDHLQTQTIQPLKSSVVREFSSLIGNPSGIASSGCL